MYGTIARLQLKPGMHQQLIDSIAQEDIREVPGYIGELIYQMDTNPDEYYLAVVFKSKEAYVANANDPAQDTRYRQLLDLLETEPEWHDGEIVHSYRAPNA